MATYVIHPAGSSVPRVTGARFSPGPRFSPEVRTSPASRAATRTSGVVKSGRAHPVSSQGALRLTRRGRVVAFIASLVTVLMVVIAAGQMADATGSSSAAAPTSVVVQSGETLWGIAREIAPGHDPRLVIAQIRELNDLGTRSIVPGQTLVVPSLR
jgi:LysM repeat protein